MKATTQKAKIGIYCKPCNLCERIKILCLLCGFGKQKNITHTEINYKNRYPIEIKPIKIDNNYYWKALINITPSKPTINNTNNEYEK